MCSPVTPSADRVRSFNAFNGSGVIFLTLSYVWPVACSLLLTKRKRIIGGKWQLGMFGVFCNVVSIGESSHHLPLEPCANFIPGWCLFAIPLFSMPSALPVTASGMNYASVVFVFGLLASALWYAISGRKYYHGPADGDLQRSVGELPPQYSSSD